MTLNAVIPYDHLSNPVSSGKLKLALGNPGWCNERFDRLNALDTSYVPMIRKFILGSEFDQAKVAAAANPSRTWILGKRPDATTGQWKATPQQYLAAAQNWSAQFGTSKMVFPNIAWSGELSRVWLQQYLTLSNRVIPGIWGIQLKVSSFQNPYEWELAYNNFKAFVVQYGVDRPVWITAINGYVDKTSLHSNGLPFFWYSSYDYSGDAWATQFNLSNLSGSTLTRHGEKFRDVISGSGGSTG